MPKQKITLKDIDGTVPGRAALVSMNLNTMFDSDNGKPPQWAGYVEGEFSCDNPIEMAWALWESIKDDHPDHVPAVLSNERAKYLRWVALMVGILDTEATFQEYLDAKNR